MHIHIVDKIKRAIYARREQAEVEARQPKVYDTVPMGDTGIKLYLPEGTKTRDDGVKDYSLTALEKIARGRIDDLLTEKAEIRATTCHHCHQRTPIAWVREVQFDLMEQKAGIDHASVSSQDYEGPVPGFCVGCISDGPALLAQAVYFDGGEMHWGFRPTRYHVIFTDGTRTGGPCIKLDPTQQTPEVGFA